MTVSVHLIAKNGKKTVEQLNKLIETHGIRGTVYAVDFYVEGAESWEAVPGGWRHPDRRIVNVDHHAPHPSMQRHVSSANMALELLTDGDALGPDDAIVISHIDCDSILSAGILRGRPHPEYGEAAIAADHTGEENEIADLLQGLDAHWSRMKMPDTHTVSGLVEGLLTCLERHEAGYAHQDEQIAPSPNAPSWAAFVEAAAEERRSNREKAKLIARTRVEARRGVHFAKLTKDEGPIEGELFLPDLPDAQIVATASPQDDDEARWRWRIRLGVGAPAWLSLHDLGIEGFDPIFGGRWNAGSNGRPQGTKGMLALRGSPLPLDDYLDRLSDALDARLLERSIEIATEAHRGQRDKAGAPYILHPLRVMAACSTVQERIVGVLHDVVEDGTDAHGRRWTFERLVAEGFGPEIVDGVRAVTARPEEEQNPELSDDENLERFLHFCRRAADHPLGRVVKRADLMDNLDVTRLSEFRENDGKRLNRYIAALKVLR